MTSENIHFQIYCGVLSLDLLLSFLFSVGNATEFGHTTIGNLDSRYVLQLQAYESSHHIIM